jgi:hypothetical protein
MSVADLKKALGEVGFTQLKKAVNTGNVTVYTVKTLNKEFGLAPLAGISESDVADNQAELVNVFEESFVNIQDQKISVVMYDKELNSALFKSVVRSYVLSLEGLESVSNNLKDEIDYDSYMAKLVKEDKLGILVVKDEDEDHLYMFKKEPALIKLKVIKQLRDLAESEDIDTNKDKQDQFMKLNKLAKKSYKENKTYISHLDPLITQRAIYDPDVREKVKLFNNLKMMYD